MNMRKYEREQSNRSKVPPCITKRRYGTWKEICILLLRGFWTSRIITTAPTTSSRSSYPRLPTSSNPAGATTAAGEEAGGGCNMGDISELHSRPSGLVNCQQWLLLSWTERGKGHNSLVTSQPAYLYLAIHVWFPTDGPQESTLDKLYFSGKYLPNCSSEEYASDTPVIIFRIHKCH